jgi:hypothetical protein
MFKMRQHRLRKDLDEYLSKRTQKEPRKSFIKDFFHKKEFQDHHLTVSEHQIEYIQNSDDNSIVIVEGEPNFFKRIHEKILSFFKKKDKKK